MSDIYSEVEIRRLEPMRVASYQVISRTPEDDVINYMKNWAIKNGLDQQEGIRAFGFDVPVSKEQQEEGLRGYEYWVTVPESALESDGVRIKNIDGDEYAVLQITEPFSDPFEKIPNGWKRLGDWVMKTEFKTTNFQNRYWLEEVVQDKNGTYMDIYFPVKDGGRKLQAELIHFTVTELNPSKVIGKKIRCQVGHPGGNPIPAFWGKCFEDGTFKSLEEHPERIYAGVSVGWMGNFDPADHTFDYIVGVFVKPDADVPEGMVGIRMPETRYAVGTIKGNEPSIYMNAHSLTENAMKKEGLQFNPSSVVEMEWYDERFCRNEGYKIIDLYIPVV